MVWALVTMAILGISYGFYWIAFYNPPRWRNLPMTARRGRHCRRELELNRELEGIPYESVIIRAKDGIHLYGRYYHIQDGAPLHIQFHGYRGSGIRDLSAGNHVARSLGWNTLVVDQRAHGKSGGVTMTFGIRERWDCLCWAKYAYRRFGSSTAVFLSGVSMGGATVLMASELPLPPNVAGIIADCPFSAPVAIIRKVCQDVHIPGFIGIPLGCLGALIWGGFALWSANATDAVKRAKVPILLIHGMEDRYVPCQMSRQIRDHCASQCFLELFPGAKHAGSCLTDTQRYRRVLKAFVTHCLLQGQK